MQCVRTSEGSNAKSDDKHGRYHNTNRQRHGDDQVTDRRNISVIRAVPAVGPLSSHQWHRHIINTRRVRNLRERRRRGRRMSGRSSPSSSVIASCRAVGSRPSSSDIGSRCSGTRGSRIGCSSSRDCCWGRRGRIDQVPGLRERWSCED